MKVHSGDIVVIKSSQEAFREPTTMNGVLLDSWDEHYFLVDEVFEDLVTGHSLTGSLIGVYGEPDLTLIKKVYHEVTN
jgi:hypothetical protein